MYIEVSIENLFVFNILSLIMAVPWYLVLLLSIKGLMGQSLETCMRSSNSACELVSGSTMECRVKCSTLNSIGKPENVYEQFTVRNTYT